MSDLRKDLMEELMVHAYGFTGLTERFPDIKVERLAEEVIMLAHQGQLEVKYGPDGSIYFMMEVR